MYLNLTNFTNEELQLHRDSLRNFIDEFVYTAFDDTEDSVYIGIHDIHNAIVDEIDRRKQERIDAFNHISHLRRQLERMVPDNESRQILMEIADLESMLRQ